ncbi:MAG TPA: trypsin-like peptidase domain-containing protein [Opitutaceae bacterium]|nr:trypsin-like peptidase domain-containing protein [Opitutaceae bacterium]
MIESGDRRPRLVLTALHVLDELIKAERVDATKANASYSGWELPALVNKVTLYDIFAPEWSLAELGSAGPMAVLPHARTGDEEPYSQCDIAAFEVPASAAVSPLLLASHPPAIGEPLWLVINAGPAIKTLSHQAVAVEQTAETLIFQYAPKAALSTHSSGGPLLNRNSEVVGINIGGGELEGTSSDTPITRRISAVISVGLRNRI